MKCLRRRRVSIALISFFLIPWGVAVGQPVAEPTTVATEASAPAREEALAIRVPDDAIRVDGRDDDWLRIPPADFKRCEKRPDAAKLWLVRDTDRGSYAGPDDCSIVLHFAHDANNVYILADVRDQYLVNQAEEASANLGDELELFIDANAPQDRFGGKYNENSRQMIFVAGHVNPKWPTPLIWQKEKNPEVKVASSLQPAGYRMEIQIPKGLFPYWKDHPELDAIGVDGLISDADAPGIDIHDAALKGALFFFTYYNYHFLSPAKLSLLKLESKTIELSNAQPRIAPDEAGSVDAILKLFESPEPWDVPAAQVIASWSPERQEAVLLLLARRPDAKMSDYPNAGVIKELAAKEDLQSRAAAQYALEALAARRILPVAELYEACGQNKDASIVLTYAWCCGANGDVAVASPKLIELLTSPNVRVRMMAALALGMLRDKAALEPLKKLAKSDPVPDVRKQAEKAIIEINGPAEVGPGVPVK